MDVILRKKSKELDDVMNFIAPRTRDILSLYSEDPDNALHEVLYIFVKGHWVGAVIIFDTIEEHALYRSVNHRLYDNVKSNI